MAMAGTLALAAAAPAMAETGQKALVLNSSVSNGAASLEATKAAANGFAVTMASDAQWVAMTAAQFADYQLVIVGDPTCNVLSAAVSQNATALAGAVMGSAGGNTKVGNRVLIGTDPIFHRFGGPTGRGGEKLTTTGIDFASAVDGATNLYITFSCFDYDYNGNGTPDAQEKLLPRLTVDPTPGWSQNQGPQCSGNAALISAVAQFATLTTAHLKNWFCSAHETFPTYPTDWTALAVSTDAPTQPTCGTDVDTGQPACGEAHILIAGRGIVAVAPNMTLDPPTAENPVGTTHTVTATVKNNAGEPQAGVPVEFVVTGANAGAVGSCVPANCATDSNGQVKFTWTGTQVGDDTVNASVQFNGATQTATAAKHWSTPAPPPSITVDKSASPTSRSEPGGAFTFNVVVTNTSAEPVAITSLTDDIYGNVATQGTCTTAIGTVLAASPGPGTTYSCSFTGSFTGNANASQTDVVTAVAKDSDNNTASDTDDATVTLTDVVPTITVDKSASPVTRPEPGGTFTFTVVVKNDSSAESVTLTSLTDDVYGDLNGQGTCATGSVLAASGGTYSCSFTKLFTGNAGAAQTDTITAGAKDDENNTASDTDDATIALTAPPCTRTISGYYGGAVTVASGEIVCFVNATIGGAVTVQSGGSLRASNSTFNGSVTSTGGREFRLCGSTVGGVARVQNSTGIVRIGDDDAGCAPNTLRSTLTVTGNTGGYEIWNNQITGVTTVSSNTSTDPGEESEIKANRISSSLACVGNTPPPTGGGNTTSGAKTGQCTLL
jgi:hypothetical protein